MGPGIHRERRFTFDIQRFDFVYLYRLPYFLNHVKYWNMTHVNCVDPRNKKAVFSKTLNISCMVTIASDSTTYSGCVKNKTCKVPNVSKTQSLASIYKTVQIETWHSVHVYMSSSVCSKCCSTQTPYVLWVWGAYNVHLKTQLYDNHLPKVVTRIIYKSVINKS